MSAPFAPVFPNNGWSCIACRRSYGFIFKRCGHCMVPRCNSEST